MASQEVAVDHFSADTQAFIGLLNVHGVRYMIVGGEAVIYYGHVRLTGDVDFFYATDTANLDRLFDALMEFWDGTIPSVSTVSELAQVGQIIQFGVPPNRIDLINKIDGITFDEAWPSRTETSIRKQGGPSPILFIGQEHLVKNKRASGRPKDMDDLRFLESRQ